MKYISVICFSLESFIIGIVVAFSLPVSSFDSKIYVKKVDESVTCYYMTDCNGNGGLSCIKD